MQNIGQNQKRYSHANNVKNENNEFKNVRIKNRMCYSGNNTEEISIR